MGKLLVYVVAAVVLVGGGWYIFSTMESSVPATTEETRETATSSPTTLSALLASGVSQQCTFTDSSSVGDTSGTVYVASGKIRGDFTAVSAGKAMKTHMISDGTTAYTWVEGMSTGYKAPLSFKQQADEAQAPALDATKSLNYSCGPWTADQEMFALPPNYTFVDISVLLQGKL